MLNDYSIKYIRHALANNNSLVYNTKLRVILSKSRKVYNNTYKQLPKKQLPTNIKNVILLQPKSIIWFANTHAF